ncbi:thermonuclease family protein [Xanthobacter sp. V2C-8]|uniref:thermonuclease family protein n=1 Tax=Xanthobacter albus TaxID=3119929 RepID=UPI00372801FB
MPQALSNATSGGAHAGRTRPEPAAPRARGAAKAARIAASVLGALAAGPLLAPGANAAAAKRPVCAAGESSSGPSARIVGMAPDGSLLLQDGRRFVPDGIVLPTRLEPVNGLTEAAARAATDAVGGREITFSRVGTDRHGRLTGAARMTGADDAGADIAARLVAAGAAYASADGACAPSLVADEHAARAARRGLWARPGAIAPAGDEEEMGRRLGLHAVAEGRIKAVGGRRETTYLNFGEIWRRDFTVLVPTGDFAIIFGHGAGSGHDPDTLRGERVRVRGVVREQGGPAIMVRSPAGIERLGERAGSEE